ncbi:MAG: exonuclease SbcCD subunit D [Ktedonobacteraceae bacterium]
MGQNTIRLIHLADIHLGYRGSTSLICRDDEKEPGRYLREVDIESAVSKMTLMIINEQPAVDVVVIAGDLFHHSTPYPRAIRYAARMVHLLTNKQIEVIVVDGNHETSSWLHTGSPTTFLRELDAHVINDDQYHVIRDEKWHFPRLQQASPLAVHVLPYRAILDENFTGVSPLPGYINVLVTHGRVTGANLSDLNSLHLKTAGIPSELLHQPWDYVALGDRHIHGMQPFKDVPAYYAGSLEALNFGEAAYYPTTDTNPRTKHGALDVRLSLNEKATVDSLLHQDARPIIRLETIDADDLAPEALMDQLRQRFALPLPEEALVLLEIQGCTVATRQQLAHEEIDQMREKVRRFDLHWIFKQDSFADQNAKASGQVSLPEQWKLFLEENETDARELSWYLKEGAQRIEDARLQLANSRGQIGDEE